MSDLLNSDGFWFFVLWFSLLVVSGVVILLSMDIYYKNEPGLTQKEIELEKLKIELEKTKRK